MNRWKTGAGDNKRQRGRGRKSSNPSNRSYESNGPEVKIRGNAPQIFDKYVQLARDASLAGDRVRAENLYQHAEHYFRLIQANQPRRDSGPDESADNDDDDVADDGYERFSDRVEERDGNNNNNNNGNNGNRDGNQSRNREPRRGRQPRQPRNEQQQGGDPLNVVTPEGEAQPQTSNHHPIHAPVTPSSVAPSEQRGDAPEAAASDEAPRRARRPRRPRNDEGDTGSAPAAAATDEAKPAKAPRAPRASRAKPKADASGDGGSESDAA
ncbi:DUF4167 domain-containing protein [Maricaulis sp.]|uniref:DUF4167 domain-containing protein n=1 Tax=Maricaulis sp. TaxID=1486257 RepID=UPI003A939742